MVPGWIDQQEALDLLVARLSEQETIGLDTEFVRVSTFHPKPGLIQIAIGDEALLIDPLAEINLQPLGQVLNGKVVSVLHAAQEDYEVLLGLTGQFPKEVFDTQIAYALLNERFSLSLAALVYELLGIEISKEETRSDWTKRPLTQSQCHYAKQDVLVLEALHRILSEQLLLTGRNEWMRQEMEAIQIRNAQVLSDGDIETQLCRFGNAWKLSPFGMSRLVHLVKWREETARLLDKPRKHVLSNKSVYSLAISNRAERQHQLVSEHLLTEKQADRFGSQLRRVIEKARDNGDLMPPPPPPLSRAEKDELKKRQGKVSAVAKELGISPEILAKKRQIVASLDARKWEPSGWRKEVLDGIFDEIS